jgi:hypothetical protein
VSAALDEQVPISLPKGTLLVLFEFLARSSDRWRPSENRQQAACVLLHNAGPDDAQRLEAIPR